MRVYCATRLYDTNETQVAQVLFIERQKKALKKFGPRTWCTKKPFGYRVIHHGYSLMSCPGRKRGWSLNPAP